MRKIDPIFVTPRVVQRDWGRGDLGEWSRLAYNTSGPVGEILMSDVGMGFSGGAPGQSRDSQLVLGDLGRAPPQFRLVFPGRDVTLPSTAPVSFWTLLEPGSPLRRGGERIRAYEGAEVPLPGGSVALEVSAAFLPRNQLEEAASMIRLPPVSRRIRATLAREDALSVEMWTLPPSSQLTPDGETCHVLVPLSRGIVLDDRPLKPGEAVLLPAWGRTVALGAEHAAAKVVVAYPDRTPTSIWRHVPGPDPTPSLLPRPQPVAPIIASASFLSEADAA